MAPKKKRAVRPAAKPQPPPEVKAADEPAETPKPRGMTTEQIRRIRTRIEEHERDLKAGTSRR